MESDELVIKLISVRKVDEGSGRLNSSYDIVKANTVVEGGWREKLLYDLSPM